MTDVEEFEALNESCTSIEATTPLKLHSCDSCSYTARRKHDLKRHTQRKHEQKDTGERYQRTFVCDQCAKIYKTRFGLAQHQKSVHLNQFKYKCDTCDKKFNFRSQYEGHLRSQFKQMTHFKCPDCKKTFRFSSSLTRHQKGRCQNKPKKETATEFICPVCGDMCGSKWAMTNHVQGFHKGRLYRCNCGKGFKWRSSFNYHIRVCRET